MAEHACLSHSAYVSEDYRSHLGQSHDTEKHFSTHDELAKFTLETLWPFSLRGKTVADVGCGGGALLDHISGLAATMLAIEPALPWAQSLIQRGYKWYPTAIEASSDFSGKVDLVLSTQVIEHVENPREFLADIGKLLTNDGIAVISTPNRSDVLMELLPDLFPSFFYRSQHRWAFDAASLTTCATLALLSVVEIRHIHRYGLANAMYWLKEGRPHGRNAMVPLDSSIDRHWQAWLESAGKSDNLYIIMSRKMGDGK
jgi:SAM-dependent methyltransferase